MYQQHRETTHKKIDPRFYSNKSHGEFECDIRFAEVFTWCSIANPMDLNMKRVPRLNFIKQVHMFACENEVVLSVIFFSS